MVAATAPEPGQAARRIGGFGRSTQYSIGVEEEFQLVDPVTFELVPRIDQMLEGATETDRAHIKYELMQSVVETATGVCCDVSFAAEQVAVLRRRVASLAHAAGATILSAGTSPASRWEDQVVTDRQRYRDIVAKLQWVARRELIFGLHVHVGVDSADKCMYVFNAMREELPLILALSANSPFWQREPSGLQSTRVKVFDAFPRSGMPPAMPGGWQEFQTLIERGARSGLIPDHTYVWWDIRPHPEFGTIEIRICDAQTKLADTMALTALVQGLVARHGADFDGGARTVGECPQLLIEENRWSAARYGIDGEMVDLSRDEMVPTRTLVGALLDRVEPFCDRLGSRPWLDGVSALLDRPGARRQLETWASAGGEEEQALRAVGAMLAERTAAT